MSYRHMLLHRLILGIDLVQSRSAEMMATLDHVTRFLRCRDRWVVRYSVMFRNE